VNSVNTAVTVKNEMSRVIFQNDNDGIPGDVILCYEQLERQIEFYHQVQRVRFRHTIHGNQHLKQAIVHFSFFLAIKREGRIVSKLVLGLVRRFETERLDSKGCGSNIAAQGPQSTHTAYSKVKATRHAA